MQPLRVVGALLPVLPLDGGKAGGPEGGSRATFPASSFCDLEPCPDGLGSSIENRQSPMIWLLGQDSNLEPFD